MPKSKSTKTVIEGKLGTYPVTIYFERRNGGRASVGTKSLLLRVPYNLTKKGMGDLWSWFMDWVRQLEEERPDTLKHFHYKVYQSGMELVVGDRTYVLQIDGDERRTATGKMVPPNELHLILPTGMDNYNNNRAIKTLCSRLVAQDYLPAIKTRVQELNSAFFNKEIKDVKLKYNSSNWGSCSSNKIINFSTRLLFAPKVVVDYVIIHELAHLVEANHSSRFWALVEKAMPAYKEHEKWLKENGKDCDF
ncbi:MAG: M48 family metallopeptidase [Bacteroidota bacterium]